MLKQSNSDSTIRGNIIRSSSFNSIVVNWQEITKGAFSQIQNKKKMFLNLCLSGHSKLSQNNNSLFALENKQKRKWMG